jgi:hypothetical protein
MEPFYYYVSVAVLVVLIVVLTFLGISMTRMKSLDVYPPMQNACPDYWDISGTSGFCGFPAQGQKNRGDIAVLEADKNKIDSGVSWYSTLDVKDGKWINFGDPNRWSALYPSLNTVCAKKRWAENNGVVFDSVTNYSGC